MATSTKVTAKIHRKNKKSGAKSTNIQCRKFPEKFWNLWQNQQTVASKFTENSGIF